MTDETNEGSEQKIDQSTMNTGILRGVRQIDGLEGRVAPTTEGQSPEPAYMKEPLFSKKVMFAWAAAALVVWIAVTFIAPTIIESVKSAIVSGIEEPGSNTAVKTVIRTKNGITITRTDHGVTIDRDVRPPSASTAPVAAPVAVPAPVTPPKPAPPVSEKK